MSGKGVRMSAKALARWKEEFKWVDRYPGVGDLAYCTLCKLTLQPKRDKLNVHNNSKSHREMEAQFGNFLIEKVSQSDFDVPSKPVNVVSSSTVSLPPVMTSSTVPSAITPSVVLSSVMTSSPALMTRITSSAVPSTGAATTAVPIIVMSSSPGVMTTRSLAETGPVISEILPHGREDQEVAGEIEEHLVEVHDQSLNNVEGEQIIGDANINIEHRVVLNENGEVILLKTNEEDTSHLQSFDNTPSNVDEIQRQGQRKTEHLLSELEQRLISGQDSDAVWRVQGGTAVFRVHKLVLAMNSAFFKRILSTEAEVDINTPDLSYILVRSVLCLFYTGRVIAKSEKFISELVEVLHYLECPADRFTKEIRPFIQEDNTFIQKARTPKKIKEDISSNVPLIGKKRGRGRPKKNAPTTSKEIYENPEENIDEEYTLEEDTWKIEDESLSNENEEVKMEVEEESVHDNVEDDKVRKSNRKKRRLTDDIFEYSLLDGHNKENELNESIETKPVVKHQSDTRSRFYFHGKNKGSKCESLPSQLFDSNPDSENVPDVVFVCTICYQYFKDKIELTNHNQSDHAAAKSKQGKYFIDPKTYLCPTCDKQIKVQHIVWFVKHIKYCGVDDEQANDILGPDDQDFYDSSTGSLKTSNDDCISSVRGRGNIHHLTKQLLGVEKDEIWGCRTCYEAFVSKEDLEDHRNTEHKGEIKHGSCYDSVSKQFSCLYCNTVVKTHLVIFIKHLKQCLVDPSVGLAKDHEEEGLEDDTTEDIIDPWGVVNKPLRVINLRSKWVCEALIGKIVPVLYPCHVCYTVFIKDTDIKEHFSTHHPEIENLCENGELYDKAKDSYYCTVCKQQRCKNQKSSVYFAYHLAKCKGKSFPVTRGCGQCNKRFNNYRSFVFHTKTSCEKQDFICHICSMNLKSHKDIINHVQYVHTDARPFVCTKCTKTFKRKGDLVIHEQSHNTNLEFSCEVCGKAFNLKKNLRRHIQIHNPIMERPHQCPHCHLRFLRKQVLENHIATHTTARKYSCDLCSVRVKTRDALKIHRKKVHKEKGTIPSKLHLQQHTLADNDGFETGVVPMASTHHNLTMIETASGTAIPVQNVHIVETSGGGNGVDVGDYTLTGIKTPASEIPVKEEVIISQFQIITRVDAVNTE